MADNISIFEVVSRLARQHQAINLGQGFPEDGFSQDIIEAAVRGLRQGSNQYPPMLGTEVLREAAAAHDRACYGIEAQASEVLVTSGATEALAAALLGLLQPGDEVVLLTPVYDAYVPNIVRAGAVPRCVAMQGPDWQIPWDALHQAFNAKTRMLVLNSPHNPTGKVFSRQELTQLAELVQAHDCVAVCDEVYEHLVFAPHTHIPLMTLPGMRERCVRIASAGKTFSLTGWKVGYALAAAPLLTRMTEVHQFLTFTVPPHLQEAVAYGLNKGTESLGELAQSLQAKRDLFMGGLQALGWRTTPCMGTYFANLDIASTGFRGDDMEFCMALVERCGVAAIPLSAFYPHPPQQGYARFCFAKRDANLRDAMQRLAKL